MGKFRSYQHYEIKILLIDCIGPWRVNCALCATVKNIKDQILVLTLVDAATGWLEFGPLLNHTAEAPLKCLDKYWFSCNPLLRRVFMIMILNFLVTSSKNSSIAVASMDSLQWSVTHKQTLSSRDCIILWGINFTASQMQVKTRTKILMALFKHAHFQFMLQFL